MRKNDMEKALDRSLDVLGEQSKKALLFHLTHTYKVPIGKDCSLDDRAEKDSRERRLSRGGLDK